MEEGYGEADMERIWREDVEKRRKDMDNGKIKKPL